MKSRREVFFQGVRDGFPIFLGYLAVSFSLGIQARKIGLTVAESALMSALNLTSAGEFAALEIIAAAGSLTQMALCQLIINLRYCLMSCALSQKLDEKTTFLQRCAVACGVTDEIFGLSVVYPGVLPPEYCWGQLAVSLPGWVLGTVLGAVAGGLLPQLFLNALGILLYGMFIAIVMPPVRQEKPVRLSVLLATALSVLFSLLPGLKTVESGTRVIILTVAVSALAALLFPVKRNEA